MYSCLTAGETAVRLGANLLELSRQLTPPMFWLDTDSYTSHLTCRLQSVGQVDLSSSHNTIFPDEYIVYIFYLLYYFIIKLFIR